MNDPDQKLKDAEDALAQAELRYRTLFEQLPDPVVVLDTETTLPIEYYRALTELGSDVVAVLGPDQLLRYVSPSVTPVLGYEPEVFLGRDPFELLHPDDDILARQALEKLLTDPNATPKIEVRVAHENGSWRVMELVARNLLENPSVTGVILNIRDITDRKDAERRIREQAALLDKARDAIMVCDLESRIVYWNKSAERVYGWGATEALGRNADDLLVPAGEVRPLSAFKGLIASGEWHGQLQQLDRSGKEVTVESRWSLVRGEDGEPESILIINTDITETRKLQAQFYRAQRMESVGALVGGIAHDLNNVLAPIMMAAELLREKVTDVDCQVWLHTLSDSARRGADVVRQILAFARGTGEEMVPVQLRHLITEHERILRETFPRSIQLETNVDPQLWMVKGNATKLTQVLMNLSVNARDALPRGGKITIRARNMSADSLVGATRPELKPGSYVVVSVADTGTGIPRELLGRIFEPFFTTKDVTKGTGLGLATAQGIVKSHDGALTVWSEPGQGTQFDVFLPAVQTEETFEVALHKDAPPRGAGQRILVVDDEAASREMIGATLTTFGYQVVLAQNGAEALELYRRIPERVDLVLTDLAMPGMDGAALIRKLRSTAPTLPILSLSGLIDQITLLAQCGWNDITILEKPCPAGELLSAVHRTLSCVR